MSLEVVTDDATLPRLWPAWEALWKAVPQATPFMAPAWLKPWWGAFGTGRVVIAVRYGANGIIGLLPLYRLGDKLLPMGVGISDYFDSLLAPDAPADTADNLLRAALQATDALRADLPELPEGARLLNVVTPPGWVAESCSGPPCPVLRLNPEPSVPKGMRRDIRQARHRAERAGGWTAERADAATFPARLKELTRLHQARWTGRGEAGVLADPAVLAFHQAAGPELLRAGLLRLEILRLRGQAAAAIYALLAPDRIFFYLSGFDADFAHESPGTILLAHMIKEAAREGRHEAHFLRGGEAYKYAWGGVDRMNTGRSFIRT